MLTNVSHELRTPLASVRVFGEFLILGWVNEPEKSIEYGEYIENESRRLTHLINSILDFSKIESGGKAYEFENADMREIVGETLKMLDVPFVQSGFEVVLEGADESLNPVRVNRDAITQSFVNLIDNAIKYSGSSKKIVIRLGQESGHVTVSVIDYGVGIPREEQERIFDKFYRVSTGLIHDVRGRSWLVNCEAHNRCPWRKHCSEESTGLFARSAQVVDDEPVGVPVPQRF